MTVVNKSFNDMPGMAVDMNYVISCAERIVNNGGTVYISISDELTRDDNDNRKFHAIMRDIHKQAVFKLHSRDVVMSEFSGDENKAVLVTWFVNELHDMRETLPKYLQLKTVIDPRSGEAITIRPSTTGFSKSIASQFCQFLWALGTEAGVQWGDPATKEYEEIMQAML